MTANLSAMNLLLATRNQHKTREFTQLLGPNFTLRDLTRACDLPEIRETGRAFEDNAVIKAIAISKVFPHEMVIADDSGLEVDALNGAPGFSPPAMAEKTRAISAMWRNCCANCKARRNGRRGSAASSHWQKMGN